MSDSKKLTTSELDKKYNASYLLPDPGGEVVRELIDQLRRLDEVIQKRDESLDKLILITRTRVSTFKHADDIDNHYAYDIRLGGLKILKNEHHRIHKELTDD